jgi:D-alanine--poly(phosphoribitol) ligase subunit 1
MKFCFEQKDFIEHSVEPERIAVIDKNRELTWLQFETEVNNICLFFKQQSWDNIGKPIILYGHKQAEMIKVMYAMMKLNITYIPIDIIYPKQRILIIQQLANVDLILNCTDNFLGFKNTTEVQVKSNELIIHKEDSTPVLSSSIYPDPLIYIIFTSGSTGEPKGVQISTKAVQSFTNWMANDFGFTSKDVFINIANFSFDLSVYEVMTFGVLGSTILLNDLDITKDAELLMQRVEKHQGTIWVSTPSFALTYARIGYDSRLNSLKYFLFCGETLPHTTAATLYKEYPDAIIFNTYGPTEATVATTQIEITKEIIDKYNPLPVGYPKPECEILIETENPEEKEGELVIVGDHVSVGYFNNEELNKQKFFLHNGKRAFRTGDLAYYQDKMLFCKGRNDDQIKMHGFRIELNEITNAICKNELVSSAATVGLKRNNEVKKIVSFVIPKIAIEKTELNKILLPFLEKSLPYYMIPGDIDIVSDFPYSTSHKIDKKKLTEEYLKRQFNND